MGVVLAGGAGSRIGNADKGLLPLRGRPLVDHVLERLRPQCARILIVANRNIDDYACLAPVIRDEISGHAGPLAGLAAAFGFLQANLQALPQWILTAPVDCPDPPRDLATRLRARLTENGNAVCALANVAGKQEPLFAMYRVGSAPETWHASAQTALREHGSPMRWLAACDALPVDFDGAGDAFHNLNTPADFCDYERTHG
ncbi:MAG: molybdenum cofactor guanylyltransferase [Xanthomonadaceae bacterium]|nr:molybdenum cofactor guanylyltransferase [Xanthomonadaceae bacterium]MDE2053314.1 molybdenum cofactor guanylyltransferase [Xanthomonadaceae bacterium]